MRDAENSGDGHWSRSAKLTIAGAVVSFTIGLAGLIGWIFRIPVLTAFHSGFIPIAPSTALIMCAYSVLMPGLVRRPLGPRVSRVSTIVAGAVTACSVLLTITSIAGIYFPIEHLGIPIEGEFYGVPIGHISPVNAAFFALTGIVIILLSSTPAINTRAFRFSAITVGFLAIVSLVLLAAYAAGGPLLYGAPLIPPALTTTVGLVGLVSGLLGVMIGRVASDNSTVQVLHGTFPYRYVRAAILGTGLFLVVTFIWFRQNTVDYRTTMGDEILHAADMSVERVTRWRRERIADGLLFAENDHVAGMVRAETVIDLEPWLRRLLDVHDYGGAVLLSGSGTVLFSTYPDAHEVFPPPASTIADLLDRGTVQILDMHVSDDRGEYTAPVVAVPLSDDAGTEPFGTVLMLVMDPSRLLLGLSPIHPDPGEGDAIFLVRLDDDALLILAAAPAPAVQRLQPVPLSAGAAPLVHAVTNTGDLVESTGADGTPVVAVAQTVPDSSWHVVVQRSASAMTGPLRRQLYLLAGFSVFVLVFLALGGLFVWRSRAARFYRSLHISQLSLQESEERYHTTLQSIGDAVIATDAGGRVEFMNVVAEDLTGWTLNEAAGRPISEVFYLVDEVNGSPIEHPVRKVLRERTIKKLTNHAELIARDDRRFPVTDTAAPIFSVTGELQGIVLVFRDQTEERFRRKQLERSKDRLRRIIDNMTSGFVLHEIISDADGTPIDYRFLDLNAAFTELTGIGREAIGDRITAILPHMPDDVEDWISRLGEIGMHGRASHFETYFRPFHRWVSVIAYSPETGKVAAILEDVTQRRAAERELSFRSEIIDHVGDAVVVTDADDTILYWNSAASALYGWTGEEALGRSREELLPSEDLSQRFKEITENLDARAFWSGEARVKRKDGADVLVLLTVTPTVDAEGRTVAVIAIGRDITARKTLELRYAGLFQSIGDAIIITDSNREIVDCNEAFTTLFGYTRESVAGSSIDVLYDTTGDHRHFERPPAGVPEMSEFKGETHFRRNEGTVFRGETTVSRLRDADGNNLGYVQVIHDLTERDLMNQKLIAAQKMEALGLIAGGIAHDFNNVLTAINGAAQMLATLTEEKSVKRYLDTIRSSVKRGISITTRMLTFVRSTEPEVISLGLGSFLAEFVDIARHTLPQHVHVRVEGIDDSQRVQVDPAQLQQVLFTLSNNAADAMPEGGEIVFTLRRPSGEELQDHRILPVDTEAYWCLDVTDAGVGMDRETQERMFEPFFTTKAKQGTGIGLPVVEMIVRLHRGWITVTSTLGVGTTFTVGLPTGAVPTHVATGDGKRLPEIVQGNNETLLIVDDEQSIRIMLEEVFTTNGYHVFTADTAGVALNILAESQDGVDLLLTDIGLPDMNGKALIAKARALSGIPIIAMTGYVDEGLSDAIFAAGADAMVNKPYDIHKLSEEISRLLHDSSSSNAQEAGYD
ncbi:MAG: PAS domain S-box protein [Spirochaetaceae bacterium]|nr:MAG: PAS domain S-box protein [Spirochaetaceae bacterium]